jgi:hypothetical protein
VKKVYLMYISQANGFFGGKNVAEDISIKLLSQRDKTKALIIDILPSCQAHPQGYLRAVL